jgi:uncharacterized protein (DUF58 family)
MIAPQSRLIAWAGVVLFSLAALAAMEPRVALVGAAMVLVVALIALLDAIRGLRRLDGVQATLPDVVRLAKGRQGELRILVARDPHAVSRVTRLRLGLAFPPEISSPHADIVTTLPKDATQAVVLWPCTASIRGNFHLFNVYLETHSPLGLWAVRKTAVTRSELRVYPNLLPEQRHLAALFLNRGLMGIHAHRQIGKGREFEKLREYGPGDNYEDIHWKTTAKRGHPITKVFQIERTQEVYAVIDASRLSSRVVADANGGATTQLERFVTAAMVLGLVAEKQGDRFGVVSFDDRVRAFVRARNGRPHYGACRDALYAVEPAMVNPDFGEACALIRTRLQRRALLVFLTNLDDPVLAEDFSRHLDVLAPHHIVLVNMINLPGVAPLFADANVFETDDLYHRLAGHLQWQKLRELERTLKRRGVAITLLDNERMCSELVSQYINVKRRQLL